MLKFLIVLGLITYLVYKIGGMFYRAGAASQQFKSQQQRKSEGSMNVDGAAAKSKRNGTIKGGDYVDYEEVK